MAEHKKFLKRCNELAQIAKKEGESSVGSVIVKDGKIIGEGTEKSKQLNDITRHAEVVAILNALENTNSLKDTILYSNVEPCLLCAYVIRHHGIKEVIFSKYSGELGGTQPPYNLLTTTEIDAWSPPPKVQILSLLF